jgi:hypothetical protein
MVKKALIVGINYVGTGNDLQGCINDANNMNALLTSQGFTVEMCLETQATTAGIKAALKRLVTGAVPGDVLVFHYSGHGSQLPSKTEADGYEEIICPIDLNWTTRVITDDDLRTIFNGVPNGVNVTVILDSCHSGDALDQDTHLSPVRSLEAPVQSATGGRYMAPPEHVAEVLADRTLVEWNAHKDINASALLIAGCRSDQTSADAYINNTYQGAATASILAAYNKNPRLTYKQLITEMNAFMVTNGYEQRPQLDGFSGLYDEVFLMPFGSIDNAPMPVPVDVPSSAPASHTALVVTVIAVLVALAVVLKFLL